LVMRVQSWLAVAKSPRSVSITRKECTSLPLQLPPPPSRTIPPSRPGNDPSKAVLKVVPSLITIPLHFYVLFSVMCLFFSCFFLSYSCFVMFTFLLLLIPLAYSCVLHQRTRRSLPSNTSSRFHDGPSSPRYGHCSRNGQQNTNKKHV